MVLVMDYCINHGVSYGLLYKSVLSMDYIISHGITYGLSTVYVTLLSLDTV